MNLLTSCKILKVEAPATAGTTTLVSDAVDMSGWGGCVFIASLGDVTNGCALRLVAEHSDNSSTGFDDLENPVIYSAGASDADNKLMAIDVSSPEKRWVRVQLERGLANAVLNGIICVLYRPNAFPTEQDPAHVLASALLVAPKAA